MGINREYRGWSIFRGMGWEDTFGGCLFTYTSVFVAKIIVYLKAAQRFPLPRTTADGIGFPCGEKFDIGGTG